MIRIRYSKRYLCRAGKLLPGTFLSAVIVTFVKDRQTEESEMTYKDFMIRFFMDLAILVLAIFILLELRLKPTFAVLFASAIMFLGDYIYTKIRHQDWVPGAKARKEKEAEYQRRYDEKKGRK